MNLSECGADARSVCPTGSSAGARLGRAESGVTAEKWWEGGEGRRRLEEGWGQRQLSPAQ